MQNTQSIETKTSPIKFSPGDVAITPGALSLLNQHNMQPSQLLDRHIRGDWGSAFRDDAISNDNAVVNANFSIHSVYPLGGEKIWIITEWDRSMTTILLPEDY